MPKTITLTVYLYDRSNGPLLQPGIVIDLYDAATTTLLATDVSRDLNPGPGGAASNEWGGKLSFTVPSSFKNPVDILFTDASFKYPGNALQYLNGDLGGRVDVDLRKVPTGTGGQASPPSSSAPRALTNWVDRATKWTPAEKEAVKQLIFNYCELIVARRNDPVALSRLARVDANWEQALSRIGLSPSLLNAE